MASCVTQNGASNATPVSLRAKTNTRFPGALTVAAL